MNVWRLTLLAFLVTLLICGLTISCECAGDDDDDDDDDSSDDDDDTADDDDDTYDCENEEQYQECRDALEPAYLECLEDCEENADCWESCEAYCDADAYAAEAACECDGSSWQETMLCLEPCFRDFAECYDENDCSPDAEECGDAWQICWDDCNY